jgi:transcriptional regulator with XRE-family HTH domain
MLKANLKYLREKKKLTQENIAEILGIGRSTYINYEKKENDIPSSILLKIAQYYDVTTDDLLIKDLGIPLFHQPLNKSDNILSDNIRILPITVTENQKQNIEFVPAKAIAGYAVGMKEQNFVKELPRFHLPKLPEGTYRGFEIQGQSMPPIHEGYIVIGKFVEHAKELKNGKRYILILRNEGIVFKKVISEVNTKNKLILASDNTEFLPYTVETKDVLEAWEFVAFVGFPNNIDNDYFILERLHNIEQQLALIASKNS